MPTRHDLLKPIWRGDTFEFTVRFKEGGVPFPIEGSTVVFTLKRDVRTPDQDALLYYTFTVPPIDGVGAGGVHSVVLQPSQTQALPLECLTYQLQLITPATPEDTVVTYLWGKAPVKDS